MKRVFNLNMYPNTFGAKTRPGSLCAPRTPSWIRGETGKGTVTLALCALCKYSYLLTYLLTYLLKKWERYGKIAEGREAREVISLPSCPLAPYKKSYNSSD